MRFSVCVVPVVAGLALAAPLAGKPNLTPAVRRADVMEKRYVVPQAKRGLMLANTVEKDGDDWVKRGPREEEYDGLAQKRSPIEEEEDDDGGDDFDDDDPQKRGILAASTEEEDDNGDGFEKRGILAASTEEEDDNGDGFEKRSIFETSPNREED